MTLAPCLTPCMPRAAWIDAFSMRLGALMPAVSPVNADAYAGQAFDEAADLDPDDAAEIFALELPPDDVGAP